MKILLGMSGGLDSTYAAKILMEAGHAVEGAVLRMHEYTDVSAACRAAKELNIPIHVIECSTIFDRYVKDYFVEEYKNGRTPNPCIVCNEKVKFFALASYAKENGFDRIATGHYAKVKKIETDSTERYAVARAADNSKDQTYMLYRLPQDILAMLVLPLADLLKSDVRVQAAEAGLEAAEKKESQEICFLPDGNYPDYIESKVGRFPEGDFIDSDGVVLGRHRGIIRYTVGQRKGLGIALGERVFVTAIDPVANTVTLSPTGSLTSTVRIRDTVFSGMQEPTTETTVQLSVKLRYLAKPVPCSVTFNTDGTALIRTAEPARAVTPGQSAVLYDGDTVVAGGFIS